MRAATGPPSDNALPRLHCASHTISGVAPGQPVERGFRARVDAVAAAGFDGLTVHFRDHLSLLAAGARPKDLRDHLRGSGLQVPAVEFLADWHEGRGTGSLGQAIATAELYGAPVINVGADLAGDDVPLSELVEPFRRLCREAATAGLDVALEVISWGRISRIDTALSLIEESGAGRLLLDSWHLGIDGPMPTRSLATLDPALVAGLQISDAFPMTSNAAKDRRDATCNRLFPGEGEAIDNAAFLAALWPAACRQGVTVEVISPLADAMPVEECAARAAKAGRRLLLDARKQIEERGCHV